MSLNNLKLGVDVVSAYIFEPEDGEESASPYVELFFDGQRYRTTVKDNNLSPVWDESFYISISDPSVLQHLNLEAFVYCQGSLLGKVSICGTSFVPLSDAVVLQYPLKKGRIFSRVKGEIWLKVYTTDDPSINSTPSASDLPRVEYSDDLVERMNFLYVNIVKARDLPTEGITDSHVEGCAESPDLFVEARVGKYKGVTKHVNDNLDPEWNVVFAFSKDGMQDSVLDVEVKNKDPFQDDSLGVVRFYLNEVPMRVPHESPLMVPRWYRLEDNMGEKIVGELMLAVWTGTQADAAFYDAWHFDDAIPIIDLSAATNCTQFRQKVYHVPTLCYARVTVIEAQDLEPTDRTRFPQVYVKAQMGDQVESTRTLIARTLSPSWNQDLLFVVADNCEEHVVLTVENHVSSEKDEILGYVTIALGSFDRRADDRTTPSRWYNLEKPITTDQLKEEKFSSRLHLRLSLDGGYQVLDELMHNSSDLRPTLDELCKTSIGVLELGICEAELLFPMKTRDGKETSDIYCVAKYGKEWIRTRTIIDSISPKYNEQYTWEVYDRATVLTVGVFDNSQFGAKGSNGNDRTIGKVEIRISTLELDRVYNYFYPLMDLQPTGFKRNGQLHLVTRFSSPSIVNIICQYFRPRLPKMHYIRPLEYSQIEKMRYKAVNIVAMQLGRTEPALAKEVVEYMYKGRSFWSMRRSKANFYRLMGVLSRVNPIWVWFGGVCSWRKPVTTVVVHILFLILVCFPWPILPMFFLYMFLVVIWNFRYRPRWPYHKDLRISHAYGCSDELDEEFDTFPTSQSLHVVQMRYDRLRTVASRFQEMSEYVATHGERIIALVTWRDRFATAIFGIFCIVAAVLVYVTPFKVLVALSGLYTMRHPWFRSPLPGMLRIFLSRLPDRTDTML